MSTDPPFVYVASHTDRPGEGISRYRFDPSSGCLSFLGKTGKANKVLYLALHPEKAILYAAGDTVRDSGQPDSLISAFRIDPDTGSLSLLNRQHTGGRTPCYISVDRSGRVLAVAHFRGHNDVGSLCTLPILPDGRIGPVSQFLEHEGSSVHPKRQLCSHIHAALFDPGNRHLLATDLGRDRLITYRFDESSGERFLSQVAETALPPGTGPRHMAFHPEGRTLYLINEINSTLTIFAYDPGTGGVTEVQTLSTLPPDFAGKNSGADIHVHPSGRYVYGSNRGHDSLAVFAVSPETGTLSLTGFASTGREPRGFALTGDGAFILTANQNSNTIAAFAVEPDTGLPNQTGDVQKADTPVCLVFASPSLRRS